ncbi:MAG: T6SS effector amidase Tae4 family protein [Acidobacteriota bacterium]
MANNLPNFDFMKVVYKGDGWTADKVKAAIGGDVNAPDIDDTCIVRISEPLNSAGGIHLIPPRTEPFRTRRGKDKRWYGLRVKEFWPYMEAKYGKPQVFAAGADIKRELFEGKTGVIGFRVHFQGGSATGHFTLWNGENLLYGGLSHDYFNVSYEAALWQSGVQHTFTLSAPV